MPCRGGPDADAIAATDSPRDSSAAATHTASACRRPGDLVGRSRGPLTLSAATTRPSRARTGADTEATPGSRSATDCAQPRRRTSDSVRGGNAAERTSGSCGAQASSTCAADPAVIGRDAPTGTVSRRPLMRSAASSSGASTSAYSN
jgi:hypothetical protein